MGAYLYTYSDPPDVNTPLPPSPTIEPADPSRWLVRSHPGCVRANLALFATGFSTFSLLYCVQPFVPLLAHDLDLTSAQISPVLSVFTLLLAFAILLAGLLSEPIHRKTLMGMSLVLSSTFALTAAMLPDWHGLLAVQALLGVISGDVPAMAMVYLAEEIHPQRLGMAMGLYASSTVFGGMTGRVLIGAVADHFGWRAAVGFTGALGLLAALTFL